MARYGDGSDGSAPTADQWRSILARPGEQPVTLINFLKLRSVADYGDASAAPEPPGSGGEAMVRYAAVSVPSLENVGGRFVLTAPFETTLMGEDEDWDMVVIGSYPSGDALLALFEDEAYCEAYGHRRAAVARQRVVAIAGQ